MNLRGLLFIHLFLMSIQGLTQSNLIAREQYFQNNPQSRSTFQYDAQGREVGSKHYSVTFSSEWGLHTSEEKKFDEAGRQIFYSRSGWEYAYDSLYIYYEVQTTYNKAGKISNEMTTTIYNISTSSEQKQKIEKVYEYNEPGCLTTILSRLYFTEGGYYESAEQYISDSQCKPLLRASDVDVTIWKYHTDNTYSKSRYFINEGDSTLFLYEYYRNNLLTEQIYRDQERKTYTYNPQGSITERRSFLWRDSVWVLTELITNTYNASNQKIADATLVGPDILSQPLRYENYTTYEYNEFGSVKYMESDWIDPNGTYSQSIATTISFRCDGKPLTWVSTDMKTNKDFSKIFYYYSSAAPCEPPSASFSFFPNPTTRFLKINTTEQLENAVLKIYNTNGQLLSEIKDTKNMSPIELDLGHLIPGTYVLKVESNTMTFSEQFVKQ